MTIPAYPLQWPTGWKRTSSWHRSKGSFKHDGDRISIYGAVVRVREELRRLGVCDDDLVISTNLKLRLDGLPRSDQGEPSDAGVAVYWQTKSGETRCMAIDRYLKVAQNIAAVAATLDAMRAIERHGGAEVLDRAFTGFTALAGPANWWDTLDISQHAPIADVRFAYQRARSAAHPDRGGSPEQFTAVQAAWEQFCTLKGVTA